MGRPERKSERESDEQTGGHEGVFRRESSATAFRALRFSHPAQHRPSRPVPPRVAKPTGLPAAGLLFSGRPEQSFQRLLAQNGRCGSRTALFFKFRVILAGVAIVSEQLNPLPPTPTPPQRKTTVPFGAHKK